MANKMRFTITVDEELFESFKKALPDYISVSGVVESWIKEYMSGLYRYEWSISEMFDVLRGKTTVDYLQKVHDLDLRGKAKHEIDEEINLHESFKEVSPHPKKNKGEQNG